MRAIIFPLNKYFYHFEKYDGSNFGERFERRFPLFMRFMDSKFVDIAMKVIVFPTALFMIIFYIFPYWAYLLLKYKFKITKDEVGEYIETGFDKVFDSLSNRFDRRRNDIHKIILQTKKNDIHLFVYFTNEMIPKNALKRELFYRKLELIKQEFSIENLSEANTKEDIEKVIQTFGIDPENSSFVSNGSIDLTAFQQLKRYYI